MFTNGAGFFTGLIGSLAYWIEQHGVERGSQPLYYYILIQIPVYEFLPALAVLFAFLVGRAWLKQAQGKTDSVSVNLPNTYALLGWWSVGNLAAFSIAGERMPWLTMRIALPFVLFGGWAIGALIERIDWARLRHSRPLLTLALVVVFVSSTLGMAASLLGYPPPFSGTELAQLQATTTFLFGLLGAVASGAGLYWLFDRWEAKQAAYLSLLAFFGFPGVLTVRASLPRRLRSTTIAERNTWSMPTVTQGSRTCCGKWRRSPSAPSAPRAISSSPTMTMSPGRCRGT